MAPWAGHQGLFGPQHHRQALVRDLEGDGNFTPSKRLPSCVLRLQKQEGMGGHWGTNDRCQDGEWGGGTPVMVGDWPLCEGEWGGHRVREGS